MDLPSKPLWKAYGDLFAAVQIAKGISRDDLVIELNEHAESKNLPRCTYSKRSLDYWQANPNLEPRSSVPRDSRTEHLYDWFTDNVDNVKYAAELEAIRPKWMPAKSSPQIDVSQTPSGSKIVFPASALVSPPTSFSIPSYFDKVPIDFNLPTVPNLSKVERLRALRNFHPAFAGHAPDLSDLLDYFRWNEEATTWEAGNGELCGTSHREFVPIWSNPELYHFYEATLLKFAQRGGSVRRVMIVNEEFFDAKCQLLLMHTCWRQKTLGFEPYVVLPDVLVRAKHQLEVDCDMIGAVNGNVAYFIKLVPMRWMVRTLNAKFIRRAYSAHKDMVSDAKLFSAWLREAPFKNSLKEIAELAEAEAHLIREYAKHLV